MRCAMRANRRHKKTGPSGRFFFQLTLRLTGLRPKPELPKQPMPAQQLLRRLQQPKPTKLQPKRRSQHQQLPKQPTKQQQRRR